MCDWFWGEHMSQAQSLRDTLEWILADRVRPHLKARGFTKSGRTFRRKRYPLWDTINFQGSRWNSVTPYSGFFVNIGVGSTEIDAAQQQSDPQLPLLPIFDRRWERVVPELPDQVTFDQHSDVQLLADGICDGLTQVVAVTDRFTTTAELVDWAVTHNKLHRMQQVCRYLATTGNLSLLSAYIGSLREQFGDQSRWAIFNRHLTEATGSCSAVLVQLGALDPLPGITAD